MQSKKHEHGQNTNRLNIGEANFDSEVLNLTARLGGVF